MGGRSRLVDGGGPAVRALFAIPALDDGGPDVVFFNLLRHIDTDRVRPALAVSSPDGRLLDELGATVPIVHLADQRYPVASLARAARATRPDVVLSTLRMNLTALAARPFLPSSTALVVRQANNMSANLADLARVRPARTSLIAAANRCAFHGADRIVAQSSPMADDLAARLGPTLAPRIRTVPNPVDVGRLRQRATEPFESPPPGSPTLVTMGRLMHQKGYDLLLEALALLRPDLPGLRTWIIGDGPDRADLERRCAALDLTDRVVFTGQLANPHPLVAAADLYVCSSRYEGFSNALVEAIAVGTPGVAPTGAAAGQDVLDETTGHLFPGPVDVAGLVDALRAAVSGRDAWGPPSSISARAEARFGARAVTSRYEDLLLEGTGRPLTRSTRGNPGPSG